MATLEFPEHKHISFNDHGAFETLLVITVTLLFPLSLAHGKSNIGLVCLPDQFRLWDVAPPLKSSGFVNVTE